MITEVQFFSVQTHGETRKLLLLRDLSSAANERGILNDDHHVLILGSEGLKNTLSILFGWMNRGV